jgi:glycyl-tRNA synthetase alpha subunit
MSNGTSAPHHNENSTTPSQTSTNLRTPYLLNRHNLKTNHHWGSQILEPKPDNTFHLYFQNINGLRLANNGLDIRAQDNPVITPVVQ